MKLVTQGKLPTILSHLKQHFDLSDTLDLDVPILLDFNANHSGVFNTMSDLYCSGQRLFILDCSFEGPALQKSNGEPTKLDIGFSSFFEKCSGAKILLITQNDACLNYFNAKYKKFNDSEAVLYNFIIYSYKNRMRFLNKVKERENFFKRLKLGEKKASVVLSLNNIAKPHRLTLCAVLDELYKDDLDYISFLARNLDSNTLSGAIELDPKRGPSILAFYQKILREGPQYTKLEQEGLNPRNEGAFPTDLFGNTSLSVLSESEFTNGTIRRVTEKSLKAIACGHNFLTVGNPFTLDYLESMGFDCGSDLFDNEYDQVTDPVVRMQLITENLINLSSRSITEINSILKSNIDRAISNVDVFRYSYNDYSESMLDKLITKI